MNRILIVVIVVIAGYLAFNSLNSEDDNSVVTTDKTISERNKKIVTELDNRSVVEVPEEAMVLQSFDSILGDYSLQITSHKGARENKQTLTVNEDNTFELRRYTLKSSEIAIDETASGDFSYDENILILTFSAKRNMTIFPNNELTLKVDNDGNIRFGSFVFLKE